MSNYEKIGELATECLQLGCSFKEIAQAAGYTTNFKRAVESQLLKEPKRPPPKSKQLQVIDALKKLVQVRHEAQTKRNSKIEKMKKAKSNSPTNIKAAAQGKSKSGGSLSVLYWNHGATDHKSLPQGVPKTAHDKLEHLFGQRLKKDQSQQPAVVVVAEMKSETARQRLEGYGYKLITRKEVCLNQIALFVRNGLTANFVHGGSRWISVDVVSAGKTTRVTGVHLHYKTVAPTYPALQEHGVDDPDGKGMDFLVIGDFNRDPTLLFPIEYFADKLKVFSASRCDHVVAPSGITLKTTAVRYKELEKNPHPVISVDT